MERELNNQLLELERRSISYPLMLIGGFVFLCTSAIIVLAVGLETWAILVLGLFAIIGLLALLYFSKMLPAGVSGNGLDWRPVEPDIQKQNLALEVESIAGVLELDPWQTTELVSAYIVAEDLAFRQIQLEQKAPVIRHVQMAKTPFDGLIIRRDAVICVEIGFLVTPNISQDRIASMLKKSAALKRHFRSERIERDVRLMVVLVTQLSAHDESKLRSKLGKDRFADTAVDIDIRLLDFEKLQRTFLSEGSAN